MAAVALTVSLALGAAGPPSVFAQAAPARSQLPATQPGLSRNEGVFLITGADDGSRLVYFIAQNTRHSILPGDLQLERQLNSLWPVREASRDEVLAFPEAAPIGTARSGLLDAPVVAEAPVAAEDPDLAEAPGAVDAPVAAEAPSVAEAPVAVDAPVVAEAPVLAEIPSLYVLQRGDNLTRLSARFSTTIPDILAANGLSNANHIEIGQTLVIPGVAAIAPEAIEVVPSSAAEIPTPAEAVTYTVKPGDSAIHIARQFGVDVDELLAANGVQNRNRVYVGQQLSIPGA